MTSSELDRDHLVARLLRNEPRHEQLPPDRDHVVERCVHAGPGISLGIETDAERRTHRLAHVRGERDLRALRDVRGKHAEPLVGVDASLARPSDRLGALERKTTRVREQVANRRAGWPCRLVEVDDAFLGRDERRERGDRLRYGRKANGSRHLAARVDPALGVDDTRSGELDRPLVDLA